MMALRHRLTLLAAATVGDHGRARLDRRLRRAAQRAARPGRRRAARRSTRRSAHRRGSSSTRRAAASCRRRRRARASPTGPCSCIDLDGDVVIPARRRPARAGRRRRPRGRARRAPARCCATRDADGVHLRVLTVARARRRRDPVRAQPRATSTRRSARLQLVLALLCAGGTLLAALFGRLFGRQVIQPVTELTAAAEHITQTDDLGRRIEVPGDDEVGRMAAALQHDARHARGLAPRARRLRARPAPARRRRLARAAHAGHVAAHEHRGAARRAASCPTTTAAGCSRTSAPRPRS